MASNGCALVNLFSVKDTAFYFEGKTSLIHSKFLIGVFQRFNYEMLISDFSLRSHAERSCNR